MSTGLRWATTGWAKVHNSDLWRQVHSLSQARGSAVALSKVKGHATHSDVARGRVTARDRHGNHGADALASEAAKSHALPDHLIREVLHWRAVVKDVQSMQVAILAARVQAVARQGQNNSSSSSSVCASDSSGSSFMSSSSTESGSCSGHPVQHILAIHFGVDHPT